MIDQDSCEWVIADEWKGPPPDGWHGIVIIWDLEYGDHVYGAEHWTNGEPDDKSYQRNIAIISSMSFPTEKEAEDWAARHWRY